MQIRAFEFTVGAGSKQEIYLDQFATSSYAGGFKNGVVVINAPTWGASGVLHITSSDIYILGYKHAAFIDWMNVTKQGNVLIIENISNSYSNMQVSIMFL